VPQKAAEKVRHKVESLLAAKITGDAMDADTARWVADLPDELADKLAAAGLVPRRGTATLDSFIRAYVESRKADLKPRTLMKLRTTHRAMVGFFGAARNLRDITPGDGDEWRLQMLREKLTENTVRKHTSIAKQFFNSAVRKRLVPSNPFADLKSAVQPNPSRFYFVTREETEKLIDGCPDAQWRLLVALSRYGGLRCPSEHLGLRWVDVDWEQERITVRSPKTEHHPGGDCRVIPLFPELRPYLEQVWDQAEPGAEYVVTRYRDTNANLRTQLLRIIRRAGLKPWPKLFQNMRSTRQTELEESFPSHVVCAWIGNSRAVAAKHYLQVTDDHYRRAIATEEKAAQNAAQCGAESGGNDEEPKTETPAILAGYGGLLYCTNDQVAAQGLEPRTRGL
jgi:integrase